MCIELTKLKLNSFQITKNALTVEFQYACDVRASPVLHIHENEPMIDFPESKELAINTDKYVTVKSTY